MEKRIKIQKMEKHFVAEHTIMNKITGFLLFVFPITLLFIDFKYSAVVACAVATFAAIQEGYVIKSKRKIDAGCPKGKEMGER